MAALPADGEAREAGGDVLGGGDVVEDSFLGAEEEAAVALEAEKKVEAEAAVRLREEKDAEPAVNVEELTAGLKGMLDEVNRARLSHMFLAAAVFCSSSWKVAQHGHWSGTA